MKNDFSVPWLGILGVTLCGGFLACSSVGNTGGDGGGGDGGAIGDADPNDGAAGAFRSGSISLSQSDNPSYSVNASFARTTPSTVTPAPCAGKLNVTMGACLAAVLCVPPSSEAGAPVIPPVLNAGAITVAGGSGGAGAAMLSFGSIMGAMPPRNGYMSVNGNSLFFKGGDMLTVMGAGGPDLPAFAAQTVVAPSDITVTVPATCATGPCPDLDRTTDQTFTWTGGGAGKVFVTYETLSDAFVVLVSCNFDAAAGTGILPKELLGHLEKAGDPGIQGVYAIASTNEKAFTVGDIPTKFTVQGPGLAGPLTVAK